jgi:hypothetical protein
MNIPPKLKMALSLAVVGFCVYGMWPQRALRHPPGVIAPREPMQQIIPARLLGEVHGYSLTALAGYAIEARVLHTKRYWGDGADLVPYDVALGWGPMSDQSILDQLDIAQSNRFFFYQWRNAPPIPEGQIVCHAANNHLIAANADIAKAIRNLRAGEVVRLRGYLVQVSRPDGFRWVTSLTRADTGNGACEVFYVEYVQVGEVQRG